MLFKVQYAGKKRYIKLNGASYSTFLRQAKEKFDIPEETNVYLVDETGTEVDEDVFSDVLEEKSDIVWTLTDASSVEESPMQSSCTDTLSVSSRSSDSDLSFMSPKQRCIDDTLMMSPRRDSSDDISLQAKELVKTLLDAKPGGEKILKEYTQTGEVKDPLRQKLVNMVVAAMIEQYGTAPPMDVRTRYALGIVTLFPCLKDPYSEKGYEHFYDSKSNEGYIAWKLKNMQRELSSGSRRSSSTSRNPSSKRGPQFARAVTAERQLEGDQCREAISLLRHTTDERQIFLKMEQTFQYRQALIHDSEKCETLLSVFPRFLDTRGLVQDFQMMFGEEISSKLMEKWETSLRQKVIKEANNLTRTPMLESLLQSAQENPEDNEESSESTWNSDMAALLLLVYLLPPPPSGKKRAVKITVREALSHVVWFHKSCRNLQETTSSVQGRQPYILAVGTSRRTINDYYIVVDRQLIPCKAKSSISAFDELFKAHYVFGISYDQALHNMYTFVQTTIYNIDVGLCHESPRVKDLRAKLLNGVN